MKTEKGGVKTKRNREREKNKHTKGSLRSVGLQLHKNQSSNPMSGVIEGNTRSNSSYQMGCHSYWCALSPSTLRTQMKQNREGVFVLCFQIFICWAHHIFKCLQCAQIYCAHTWTHTSMLTHTQKLQLLLQPVFFKSWWEKACQQIKREGCVLGVLMTSCVVRHLLIVHLCLPLTCLFAYHHSPELCSNE